MEKLRLRNLQDHCFELSYFFASQFWLHVAEWLGMASGIVRVEFDTLRHNPSFGWCSLADEYDYQRDTLLSSLATELATFSFVWGSLESTIDRIVPRGRIKQLGKINAACDYLKTNFEPTPPLTFYRALVDQFHDSLLQMPHYRNLKELRFRPSVGISGVGLYTVYRIRNAFAHGSLIMPQPPDEDSGSPAPELISVSSRLVLLSIQMLALAYYGDEPAQFDCWWRPDEPGEVDLQLFLRTVHIERISDKTGQLSFPLT